MSLDFERIIFGPKYEKESWRMLYNYEIDQLFSEPDVVTLLKIQRLRRAGHVVRMEEDNPVKTDFSEAFWKQKKGSAKVTMYR
jgi:hypothetical protein